MKKKEDPKKILERVRRYRQNKDHQKVEIVGLTEAERDQFINLKGLEDLSFSNKLRFLMKVWEKNHEKIHDDLIFFDKDNYISNISIFNQNMIYNNDIINFINFNKISIKSIINNLEQAKKFGILDFFRDNYLNYLKYICQKERIRNLPVNFISMINNKKYIEPFLQGLEAQKREEEIEKLLIEKYMESEIEKARQFLVGKRDLYFSLIEENLNNPNKRHISIVILSSSLEKEQLLGNKLIIKALLTEIFILENYPYISFQDWKKLQIEKGVQL